jgi:hypothetical protein
MQLLDKLLNLFTTKPFSALTLSSQLKKTPCTLSNKQVELLKHSLSCKTITKSHCYEILAKHGQFRLLTELLDDLDLNLLTKLSCPVAGIDISRTRRTPIEHALIYSTEDSLGFLDAVMSKLVDIECSPNSIFEHINLFLVSVHTGEEFELNKTSIHSTKISNILTHIVSKKIPPHFGTPWVLIRAVINSSSTSVVTDELVEFITNKSKNVNFSQIQPSNEWESEIPLIINKNNLPLVISLLNNGVFKNCDHILTEFLEKSIAISSKDLLDSTCGEFSLDTQTIFHSFWFVKNIITKSNTTFFKYIIETRIKDKSIFTINEIIRQSITKASKGTFKQVLMLAEEYYKKNEFDDFISSCVSGLRNYIDKNGEASQSFSYTDKYKVLYLLKTLERHSELETVSKSVWEDIVLSYITSCNFTGFSFLLSKIEVITGPDFKRDIYNKIIVRLSAFLYLANLRKHRQIVDILEKSEVKFDQNTLDLALFEAAKRNFEGNYLFTFLLRLGANPNKKFEISPELMGNCLTAAIFEEQFTNVNLLLERGAYFEQNTVSQFDMSHNLISFASLFTNLGLPLPDSVPDDAIFAYLRKYTWHDVIEGVKEKDSIHLFALLPRYFKFYDISPIEYLQSCSEWHRPITLKLSQQVP